MYKKLAIAFSILFVLTACSAQLSEFNQSLAKINQSLASDNNEKKVCGISKINEKGERECVVWEEQLTQASH